MKSIIVGLVIVIIDNLDNRVFDEVLVSREGLVIDENFDPAKIWTKILIGSVSVKKSDHKWKKLTSKSKITRKLPTATHNKLSNITKRFVGYPL